MGWKERSTVWFEGRKDDQGGRRDSLGKKEKIKKCRKERGMEGRKEGFVRDEGRKKRKDDQEGGKKSLGKKKE